MEKFRLLSLLLVMLMILTMFAGCGEKNDNGQNSDSSTESKMDSSDTETTEDFTTEKIVNDDGDEFTVDTSVRGEIKSDAEPLSSNKFVLGNKTYSFPIKISELIADGWSLPSNLDFDNEFEAGKTTSLISFSMSKGDGGKIKLNAVRNTSSEVKEIQDCELTSFAVDIYDIDESFSFVIPGGITIKSTAADVLSVFGDPNKTSEFNGYCYNLDDQLTYEQHKSSHMTYSFSFNDDGTLDSVHCEIED